jgi:hypothetical protein
LSLVIVDMKLSSSSTSDACITAADFFSSSAMACASRETFAANASIAPTCWCAGAHLEFRLGSIDNVVADA